MNEYRDKSMLHLGNLYATAAGVSLSLGVYRLLEDWSESRMVSLLLFASFLAILVPFYHGALLHLDYAYSHQKKRTAQSKKASPSPREDIAHLFDFVLLFIESFLLVAIAYGVSQPDFFWWGVVLLLAVDIGWVLAGKIRIFKRPRQDEEWARTRWAAINLIALLLLVALRFVYSSTIASAALQMFAFSLFVIILARTVVDYIACWRFYYPKD